MKYSGEQDARRDPLKVWAEQQDGFEMNEPPPDVWEAHRKWVQCELNLKQDKC